MSVSEKSFQTSFQEWLMRLAASLDIDFNPLDPRPEIQEWLFKVYCENGDIPVEHLAPLVYARRARLAETATAAVRSAFEAEGHAGQVVGLTVIPPLEAEPMGVVQFAEQRVHAIDALSIAVEVADGFQCFVADALARVWPICSTHSTGAHPRLVADAAAWVCPTTGHVIGLIFEK